MGILNDQANALNKQTRNVLIIHPKLIRVSYIKGCIYIIICEIVKIVKYVHIQRYTQSVHFFVKSLEATPVRTNITILFCQ